MNGKHVEQEDSQQLTLEKLKKRPAYFELKIGENEWISSLTFD